MTVSVSDTSKVQYNGNGATVAFSFSYKFFEYGDLKVYLTNTSTNVTTLQTISTHYTLGAAPYTSGTTVTFVTAPTSSERVTIVRDLPIKQETDYQENDAFPADAHETALDRLTLVTQQLARDISESLQLDEGSTLANLSLPEADAGKPIKWNPGGDGFVNGSTDLDSIISTAAASETAAGLSETAAAASETAAGASETAAAASEAAALASENKAQLWAEEDEDVTVDPGEYSAKHHALKAEGHKDALAATLTGNLIGWEIINTTATPVQGSRSYVDTTGGTFTVTLATTPVDPPDVTDPTTEYTFDLFPGSDWEATPFTIDPNGAKIEGTVENLNVNWNVPFRLKYSGATTGYTIEHWDRKHKGI